MKNKDRIILLIAVLIMAFLAYGAFSTGDGEAPPAASEEPELTVNDLTILKSTLAYSPCEHADILASPEQEGFDISDLLTGLAADSIEDFAIAYSLSQPEEVGLLTLKKDADKTAVNLAIQQRIDSNSAYFSTFSADKTEIAKSCKIVELDENTLAYAVSDSCDAILSTMQSKVENTEKVIDDSKAYDDYHGIGGRSYDYKKPVPASAPKDESCFADAAFIGDSRMKGIMLASKFEYGADYSHKGMTVSDVFTKNYINLDGQYVSIPTAMSSTGPFSKVYIMLGINELGWSNFDLFTTCYADIVDMVRETQPDAQIYVIGVLPVGLNTDSEWLTNERVKLFNDMIKTMTEEKQVYYIDGFAALETDGALPDDAAPDGIHMEPGYCRALTDYLRSHIAA